MRTINMNGFAIYEEHVAMEKDGHLVGFLTSGKYIIRSKDKNGENLISRSDDKEIRRIQSTKLTKKVRMWKRKGYKTYGKRF